MPDKAVIGNIAPFNDDVYRLIVDTMTEGAVILDDASRILYCNPCFAAMVDCRPADMTGHAVTKWIAPDDLPHFSNFLAYSRESAGKGEACLLRNGKETVPAGLSAAPLRVNGLHGLFMIVSDNSLRRRAEEGLLKAHEELEELVERKTAEITNAQNRLRKEAHERKSIARKLTEKEERFKLLLENASDIVLVLRSGSIVYTGPSVKRILGYEMEEVKGKEFADLVFEEDRKKAANSLAEAGRIPGISFTFEVRIVTRSGEVIRMEAVGRNLLHFEKGGGLVVNMRETLRRKAGRTAQ